MLSKQILANTIRVLSMDAVEKANSGHPGAPMGMADIAEVLWRNYMNHNPSNPTWVNRDRFVLSNGHGSMLLYSLLHLTGYNLSIEDLKKFRQLYSKTPGHPEYGYTPGVETTTGPLGQGLANAVGFAISERTLAAQFNREGHEIINHNTYVFLGDGCMMEGISHEACSLAGTMKLGKLTAFYDDNGISIDGNIKGWFNDNTATRFESYGWHVIRDVNGHDSHSIKEAIEQTLLFPDKPSLLICKTIIAFGAPTKAGTCLAHGAPLGKDEITATRKALGWNDEPFIITDEIYQHWDATEAGEKKEKIWNDRFSAYEKDFPKMASEFKRRIKNELPLNWKMEIQGIIKRFQDQPQNIATRKASQNTLNSFCTILPELIGGSADLSPSNLTISSRSTSISDNKDGNYIHYGVREFAMTAIANGIAHYGGFLPYTATFLMFVDYARNAVRMAALMKTRHIMIYTHDSIGLGEDGPTHQPIEQLASLRLIPNISVWRPCDQVETAVSWKNAIEKTNGPTALILSRQNLKQQDRTEEQLENITKGGYVLKDCFGNKPELILIATGSEVELAVKAHKQLQTEGYKIRVVSMPSTDIFDAQDATYRELVLPKAVKFRIAIEAGIADFWHKYVGFDGKIIGMNSFGESAPAEKLFEIFGFTIENIIKQARLLLNK
ncbi:transketolase [secondary endosymbiont of Heteropsylla cubana]|uniref:Transketolase n=1 Tax=secondary endosymbiont of Heteropsylla cubana TaxID=134287 RepID=J3Z551_9ENTR|nr:transketolase [secondary endosymbiont of Heteropsylla cubana]AFP85429.1 transketolase [secondary endosymbiont of Heteropsylla cubana]